jgi:hypothetical protein
VGTVDWKQDDFFPYADTGAAGKNLSSLERSRYMRREILKLFGGEVPGSIMVARKLSRKSNDTEAAGSYGASETEKMIMTGDHGQGHVGEVTAFTPSGKGARAGGLSTFPQNIGRAMVLLYTNPGHVVVDPFAGHNSRMQLCVELCRHYVGYDISKKFMLMNEKLRQKLAEKYPRVGVKLHCCDSRKLLYTRDEFGDFTITSPPYYNLEYYGDEPGQLGKLPSYAKFIDQLLEVAKENFRVLKHGSYCVWFVNDFRLKGIFFPFHVDTIALLNKAGFRLHDILITDFGPPIGQIFMQTTIGKQILPKRHEYGIVVRKP